MHNIHPRTDPFLLCHTPKPDFYLHWRPRKQYSTQVTRLPHREACEAECVRSAPLGTPRTASRIRSSGCRRRAGARLLLAGDTTFEDVLGIIRYCRIGDLLRVVLFVHLNAFVNEPIIMSLPPPPLHVMPTMLQ